jgi:hypothetical protein
VVGCNCSSVLPPASYLPQSTKQCTADAAACTNKFEYKTLQSANAMQIYLVPYSPRTRLEIRINESRTLSQAITTPSNARCPHHGFVHSRPSSRTSGEIHSPRQFLSCRQFHSWSSCCTRIIRAKMFSDIRNPARLERRLPARSPSKYRSVPQGYVSADMALSGVLRHHDNGAAQPCYLHRLFSASQTGQRQLCAGFCPRQAGSQSDHRPPLLRPYAAEHPRRRNTSGVCCTLFQNSTSDADLGISAV